MFVANCNAKLNYSEMKKILFVTTIALVLVMFGCGNRNDSDSSKDIDSVPAMPYNTPIDTFDQDSMDMMDDIDSMNNLDSVKKPLTPTSPM